MKIFTVFILFSFMVMAATITTAHAGEDQSETSSVLITIMGFENSSGVAKVAISNSKENWEALNYYSGYNFKIIDKQVVKTLVLPQGEYAIKVFHDENGNDELDTRMFGIPKERYGFSNNAKGSFGPPEYKEAVFVLDSRKKEITINIH
ncbi:MAG: hypothetical protein DRH26_14725 [Deltaproteobacteria bacterium]|nr:MAG: hypothetical protein DRH26_14725 [Deltaproteobacteria bacterium]